MRPPGPRTRETLLPGPLYDALTSGQLISIGYVNGEGRASQRMIRPFSCFPVGRHVYVRAHCTEAAEMRTFRMDRIVEVADPDGSLIGMGRCNMVATLNIRRPERQNTFCRVCGRAAREPSRGDCPCVYGDFRAAAGMLSLQPGNRIACGSSHGETADW
jgi:hypothetical protein